MVRFPVSAWAFRFSASMVSPLTLWRLGSTIWMPDRIWIQLLRYMHSSWLPEDRTWETSTVSGRTAARSIQWSMPVSPSSLRPRPMSQMRWGRENLRFCRRSTHQFRTTENHSGMGLSAARLTFLCWSRGRASERNSMPSGRSQRRFRTPSQEGDRDRSRQPDIR